ncbi:hypothetical protein [Akkermansia sp.]|uniref:hypothetical protein n=1 Tax=Akkermansia sp. TaxID=1872421 RepID=UPI0025B98760|nr:hypothetical protein [Akkermansia sp.]MCC8149105.1 hypothetical protein [Akkermansia sp.]
MADNINFKTLREQTHLTLSNVAELSGCTVLCIAKLERGDDVSPVVRNRVLSILLQMQEDGPDSAVKIWRDRALRAEEKLALLKDSMVSWIRKI